MAYAVRKGRDRAKRSPKGDQAGWTVQQAKDWLRGRLSKGDQCPVCARFAKSYRRGLTAGMAVVLIQLHRSCSTRTARAQGGFVEVAVDVMPQARKLAGGRDPGGDWAKLRWWGLIEPQEGNAGWWRITPEGRGFVSAGSRVKRFALVYDDRRLGLEGEPWTIHDALGKRFSYEDLLRESGRPEGAI